MHHSRGPHLEAHPVHASEIQLGIDVFVGTVVVDEEFCLFEIGPSRKRSIAVGSRRRDIEVAPDVAFSRAVELCGGNNPHRALRVGVIHYESLSRARMRSGGWIRPYRRVCARDVNVICHWQRVTGSLGFLDLRTGGLSVNDFFQIHNVLVPWAGILSEKQVRAILGLLVSDRATSNTTHLVASLRPAGVY